MKKKFKKQKTSRYENEAILISSKVVSIEQKNVLVGERYKNVFYVESSVLPEKGRMCVLWERSCVDVGDEIEAKGRINTDGVFLAWSMFIKKRAKQNEVQSG